MAEDFTSSVPSRNTVKVRYNVIRYAVNYGISKRGKLKEDLVYFMFITQKFGLFPGLNQVFFLAFATLDTTQW